MRVAIVGAGLAGLAAAGRLREAGMEPVVFDKARGPGGRASSKRMPFGSVDLGAQYFTVRDPAFATAVAQWEAAGVVARWQCIPTVRPSGSARTGAPEHARYVGVPRMSALARHLAEDLDLRSLTHVDAVEPAASGGMCLWHDGRCSDATFDRVIVALPAPQAGRLPAPVATDLTQLIQGVRFAPCWAAAYTLSGEVPGIPDAAFVNAGPLRWMVRDSAKPGRNGGAPTWVVHATPEWSGHNLELDAEAVGPLLWAALREQWPALPATPGAARAHRWRYARALNPLGRGALAGADGAVVYAGDWVTDARLEGAWLSGRRAAERVLKMPK